MQIEISSETAKRIEAAVGNSDPATIMRIFERVSMDQHLLMALTSGPLPAEDVEAIREGITDLDADRVEPFSSVDASIRRQFGFSPRS